MKRYKGYTRHWQGQIRRTGHIKPVPYSIRKEAERKYSCHKFMLGRAARLRGDGPESCARWYGRDRYDPEYRMWMRGYMSPDGFMPSLKSKGRTGAKKRQEMMAQRTKRNGRLF